MRYIHAITHGKSVKQLISSNIKNSYKMWKLVILLAVLLFNTSAAIPYPSKYDADSYNDREFIEEDETEPPWLQNWTGRWFPARPNDPTPPPKVWPSVDYAPIDHLSMGKMYDCDDGKTKLEVDWNRSNINFTCFGPRIQPDVKIDPILETVLIPPAYRAPHRCMNETIEYYEDLPVYGTHRPVYPVFGEYKFLPKQRWLHSLEHGAVVALFHPCANPLEVNLLKKMIKQCLRRHIISPYDRLDQRRPLALLAWGSRLTMSYVNPGIIRDFIRERSLRGPENIPQDGEFDEGLIRKAQVVSDFDDSMICPNM
ncbi:uncharacterized protein [Venturia canescens]|uniref:uncharacterized protein isoform X2 n=1 Tax=Venturia canescens TaxID=32260 RepID=UPI001C9C119B|nr:uncharacterized protein LOC122408239 isoform X2 [Venturia canescens]